jgi:DNA-binding response OmpR family regulator
VGDKAVELTAKEFGLFDYLYNRAGKIVSREELLREVWKRDTESNIVDVYASYLRRKLDFILPPGSLTAVRGLGYVLKI